MESNAIIHSSVSPAVSITPPLINCNPTGPAGRKKEKASETNRNNGNKQ